MQSSRTKNKTSFDIAPVPAATVGQRPTDAQWEAIFAYLSAHPGQRQAGIIITARLANEAITWFNERNME